MDRASFIKTSCMACLGLTGITTLLSGCTGTRFINGQIESNGLRLQPSDFAIKNSGFASYIIVRNDALKFPICVFRFSSQEYSAVWMKCSHQGAELQASGEVLQCPAHGSEFDNRGKVIGGPATEALRTFPITVDQTGIFIDLRKVQA